MTVKKESKRKRKTTYGITILIFLGILAIGIGIGWIFLSREHREAASLPLNAVDFDRLEDGYYHGIYAGGMYKWRANECDVLVENGSVIEIQLSNNDDVAIDSFDYQNLYQRVVNSQSLQVDTISGATLTSKAYLQCVENALVQAQRD